jgi:hypothetical protein
MTRWEFPPAQPDDYRDRIRALGEEQDPPVRNQHVVSKVLLKGFAAPGRKGSGWQLTPYDVAHNRELRSRSLRECGKTENFLAFASGSAENHWATTVENKLGDAVAAARRGELLSDRHLVDVIKDAIALHIARSHHYMAVHNESVARTVEEVRRETLRTREPMLRDEFRRRYGLDAAGPEALGMIVDPPIAEWLELHEQGALVRVTMEETFERTRVALRPMNLEVCHTAAGGELLISDSPAHTVRYADDGAATLGVAIGDAHAIVMPVAADCVVAIGPEDLVGQLDPEAVERLNLWQILVAHRYVYYRPRSPLGAFVASVVSSGRRTNGV